MKIISMHYMFIAITVIAAFVVMRRLCGLILVMVGFARPPPRRYLQIHPPPPSLMSYEYCLFGVE